jgi:phospholipid-binding lipoprotein MlaA
LKPGKAAETAGRFVINSTIGLAGLFDIAKRKPFKRPRRRYRFSDTLGFYGVKPGAVPRV